MIDVVIPYYGSSDYLLRAVQSVVDQTLAPASIWILDDCFPDADAARKAAALAPEHVRVVRNDTNLGANENYRRALATGDSEYLVIFGADDIMRPDFIAHATTILKNSDYPPAVVQSGVAVINESGQPYRPMGDRVKARIRPRGTGPRTLAGEQLAISLLRGNWTYFPSLVWNRQMVERIGFRRFDIVQDLALLLDLTIAGGHLALDERETFAYRRHSSSDSAVHTLGGKRFAEEATYFATIADELDALGWHRAARASRMHVTSRLHGGIAAVQALRSKDLDGARAGLNHLAGPPLW